FAIRGLAQATEDPYTFYQNSEEAQRAREHLQGSFQGIGIRVRLQDGSLLLLYYVPELDLWSGIPFAPAPHRAARRKDRA
ncbi:MAG: hypothetical protein WD359_10315, partial [Dehalococcoidia bacterium]